MQNMHQSMSALLFPGYRRRVLGLLLLRPEEGLHGREIARRTGLPAGTLTRELKRLAEAGLLNQERRGNQILYSANRGCSIYTELAAILGKMECQVETEESLRSRNRRQAKDFSTRDGK
jgi:DNA-binding transcriptional ArsR family regulator